MPALSPRDIAVIAKREYIARIRTKGFWISTVALPILMAAWMIIPSLIISKTRSSQSLAVVDSTGKIAAPLVERLDEWAKTTARQVSFDVEVVPLEDDHDALRARLDERTLGGEIQAWIWIDESSLAENSVEYHAESLTNFITQQALERGLSSVIRRVRLEDAGHDVEAIGKLTRSVDLATVRVSEEGSEADGGIAGFALAIALFMLLYMTTLIYGNQVMLGVLEEKSSRVVEVLIASVRPLDLMLGKLSGIGLIGLTQLSIWIGTALVLTAPGLVGLAVSLPEGVDIPTLTVPLVLNFFGLFILGYFLYATFYAMVGSAFNNPQEAQQLASLAVVFVVLPWLFFMPILNDPDSTLAVVTSLIPMFTPTLMMLRIAVKMPPAWQIFLGYLLTTALAFGMSWLCARIYRVGILMYGKKPTLKELWRWIRYA
jgi:ABC-2 type transport system permease protein